MYVHSIFTGWSRKLSAGYSRGLLYVFLFDVVDLTTLWLKAVLAVSVHSDLLCIHAADVEYSKGVVKVSN